LGNYVLLLVDSVNALYDTLAEILVGDFSFTQNKERMGILKILSVFTLGSAAGLVTFSHLLSYLLKHFREISNAVIIGFITGSLGVVWPWKKTLYKKNDTGNLLMDSNGDKITANYERFFPDMGNLETWWAIAFIILGILVLLLLDWYGKKRDEKQVRTAG